MGWYGPVWRGEAVVVRQGLVRYGVAVKARWGKAGRGQAVLD